MFFPAMAQMMVRRQAEPWDGVVQLSALVVPTVGAGGLGLIAVDPVSTDTVQLSALVVPTVGAGGLGLIAVDPVSPDTIQLSAPVVPTISVNTSVAAPPTT